MIVWPLLIQECDFLLEEYVYLSIWTLETPCVHGLIVRHLRPELEYGCFLFEVSNNIVSNNIEQYSSLYIKVIYLALITNFER